MTTATATASKPEPVIGTMNADQYARAQTDTARIIACPKPRHRNHRRTAKRLPPYCGCCGCLTRYCNCSCCCQK